MNRLDRIKEGRFLVIGRAGMDFTPSPPGVRTEEAETFVSGLGGSSANIAAGLCKLGCEASLMTCVSDDSVGRFCVNQLKKFGVGTDYVKPIGGEFRNSLAVYESRIVDTQSVIYRNGAADFQMSVEDVEAPDYAAFGGLITTGTVFAAEPSRSAAFHAFDLAKAAGLPLIFDVDYRPYSWGSAQEASEVYSRVADYCDIIIGNDDEFGFMAGDYNQGLAKARALAATSASIIVYKMGEKGAITITADSEVQTGIFVVEALKPTGAGDAFMGGFMASLAAQRPVKESVIRGSAAAALTVSRVGCADAIPTLNELDHFLTDHEDSVL